MYFFENCVSAAEFIRAFMTVKHFFVIENRLLIEFIFKTNLNWVLLLLENPEMNNLVMFVKKEYDAPALFIEEVVCNRGFEVSPFEDGFHSDYGDGEEDEITDLY